MYRLLLILVFSLAVLLPVKVNSETLSGWGYDEVVDEFTDELSFVGAGVSSSSVFSNSYVTVACLKPGKDNQLVFLIKPEFYINILEKREEVKIRIDKNDMETYQARSSLSAVGIFNAHKLARRMMWGNKMIIKVGDSDTIRVSLNGSAKPIQKVLGKCK